MYGAQKMSADETVFPGKEARRMQRQERSNRNGLLQCLVPGSLELVGSRQAAGWTLARLANLALESSVSCANAKTSDEQE